MYWCSSYRAVWKRVLLHSGPTPTTTLQTPPPSAGGNSSFSFSGASVPELMWEFLICFNPELNFALQFCILAIYQLRSCSSFRLNFSIIPAFYICEQWDQLDRKPRFLILEVKDTWSSWITFWFTLILAADKDVIVFVLSLISSIPCIVHLFFQKSYDSTYRSIPRIVHLSPFFILYIFLVWPLIRLSILILVTLILPSFSALEIVKHGWL